MYILHVDHGAALGGAERSMIELARAQHARGHRVAVAAGRSDPLAEALETAGLALFDLRWPVELVAAPRSFGASGAVRTLPIALRAARRLRSLVQRERPDVVHVHTRKAQLVASLSTVPRPARVVWHLRDDVPERGVLRRWMGVAIRRVDHAVALTSWMAARYVEAGLRPRSGRIGLVPSSVDPAGLRELPRPFLASGVPPVPGYVGQIARWKAPHLLVEAAEHLADQRDASFAIVGDVLFSPAEDLYGQWLRERIARSPAADRIRWLGAVRSPVEAFREIDVLVHTSTSPEPFGRVLVEAMMSGRPIVTLAHGAPAELLDASCAVFAERPDGAAVAAAIRTVIADPDAAGRMVERAAIRSRAFEPPVVAAAMDDEYRHA